MALDAVQLIYLLIGSTLGIVSFVKVMYDFYKEQIKWYSGYIESSFKREDEKILVELKFQLINNGRRSVSIPFAFLRIIDSKLPDIPYETCLPENFTPINLKEGEAKPVALRFISRRFPEIKPIQEVRREEMINHGIHARLLLIDGAKNKVEAWLFIYEGGMKEFLIRLGAPHPIESEIIFRRTEKSFLRVG